MSVAVVTRAGRALEDVAAAIGRPPAWTRELLEDSARLGLVERLEDGRWALTAATAAKYGRALGAMGGEGEE